MTSQELRKKFRDFFVSRNHVEIPSSSLIPDKSDPTVLLNTAGMQPLVPYFMGAKHPQGKRIFDTQKCFRTPDIDEVGDDTHHTFFEMLGNWSFGDYFKEEAIDLAYDFLVKSLGMDPSKFAITIFKGDSDAPRDNEAEQIWMKKGIKKEQIFEFDKADNFWGPAGKIGPCGPCSEIHYDRGENYGQNFGPNCDENQRFVEIWNLVFMEYNKKEDGSYEKLAQKNVDTGIGFERLLSILNQKDSAFDSDLFENILQKIENISAQKYHDFQKSFRIIADHARGSTFLIADGISPGNSGREYILKRIIRRAILHAQKICITEKFLQKIANVVIEDYSEQYPELQEGKDHILQVLQKEEENFLKTLYKGREKITSILEKSNQIISGEDVFQLFDTYGFPLELTEEIAAEKGVKVDKEGFVKEMSKQKERSRQGSKTMFEREEDLSAFGKITSTIFQEKIPSLKTKVLLIQPSVQKENIYFLALQETPFYAESGGQIADSGQIIIAGKTLQVKDVQKNPNNVFIHQVFSKTKLPVEELKGKEVLAEIDQKYRNQIKRHHSSAHLLQSALREVLGLHVKQSGSEVTSTHLRFDFTHPKNLSTAEIKKIEDILTSKISANLIGKVATMSLHQAKEQGALALFAEKFSKSKMVRTVRFGDFSFELCGGVHVEKTGEIGAIKIISESSISSGIRRIELVCSDSAQNLLQKSYKTIENLSAQLKVPFSKVEEKITLLLKELKFSNQENKNFQKDIINFQADKMQATSQNINGKTYLIQAAKNEILALLAKKLVEKIDLAIVFSAKGNVAIASSKNFSSKKILQKIMKEFSGKGGGSNNFAQGGGCQNIDPLIIKDILKDFI